MPSRPICISPPFFPPQSRRIGISSCAISDRRGPYEARGFGPGNQTLGTLDKGRPLAVNGILVLQSVVQVHPFGPKQFCQPFGSKGVSL